MHDGEIVIFVTHRIHYLPWHLIKLVKHVWLNIFLEYPDVVITVLPALLVPQTYSMTNFVDDGSHKFTTRTY